MPARRHESLRLSSSWEPAGSISAYYRSGSGSRSGSGFGTRFHSTERRRYDRRIEAIPTSEGKLGLVQNRFDKSDAFYMSEQSVFNRTKKSDSSGKFNTLMTRKSEFQPQFADTMLDQHRQYDPEKSRAGVASEFLFTGKPEPNSVSAYSVGSKNQSVQTSDVDFADQQFIMIPEPDFSTTCSGDLDDDYDVPSFSVVSKHSGSAPEANKKDDYVIGTRISSVKHRQGKPEMTSQKEQLEHQSGRLKNVSGVFDHEGHFEAQTFNGKYGSSKNQFEDNSDQNVFHSSKDNCWTYSGQCDVEILSGPGSIRVSEKGVNRMGLFPTLPNRTRGIPVEKPVRKCESFQVKKQQQQQHQKQQKQQHSGEVSKEKCNTEKSSVVPEPSRQLQLDENENVCGESDHVMPTTNKVLSSLTAANVVSKLVASGSVRRQKSPREIWLKRSKSRARMLKTEEQVKLVKFRRFLKAANIDADDFKKRIVRAKKLDVQRDEKER